MACNKQKITKHDRFSIFRSGLEMVMSRILKDDNLHYLSKCKLTFIPEHQF